MVNKRDTKKETVTKLDMIEIQLIFSSFRWEIDKAMRHIPNDIPKVLELKET